MIAKSRSTDLVICSYSREGKTRINKVSEQKILIKKSHVVSEKLLFSPLIGWIYRPSQGVLEDNQIQNDTVFLLP